MAREPATRTRRSRIRATAPDTEALQKAEGRADAAERELDETREQLRIVREQADEGIARVSRDIETLGASAAQEILEMREEVARLTAPPAPPGPRAYLLLRSDLPSLGVGKGRAQSMHAGNAMTWALVVEPMLKGEAPDADVMAWHREAQGFGTAISLGGPGDVTAKVIEGIAALAGMCGMRFGEVVDDTYPYIVDEEIGRLIDARIHTDAPRRIKGGWLCCRREVTGLWLFGTKAQLDPLLGSFDLTPDA